MRKKLTNLILAMLFGALATLCLVRAQEGGIAPGETAVTNPKDRDLSVTATVPSTVAPPVPVLVSPENNSLLTSGVVTFVWRAVTGHTVALDRYELYINGVKRFNVSTSPESNDDYVLTFNGTNYSLALRPDKYLPDGVYTWRIRVVDVNGVGTDSSTWNFTIDSTPPPLILTNIDGNGVLISATDPQTIPDEPIVVVRSQPVIIGRSEAGATIQLTVTLPDNSTRQYQVTADVNGVFGFHLEALPANQVVRLRFVAIDTAGLSTALDGVELIYLPPVIVIPIPPIIPGLPPEVVIPIPPPPVIPPIFPTPFPPFEPGAPTPSPPVRIVKIPIFDATFWLMLYFAGLLLYVLTLFFITGSQLGFFPAYLTALLRFFFFPWLSPRHELREQDRQRLLPWTGFNLVWMDARRRVRSRRVMTDFAGRWQVPLSEEVMYHAALHSRCFEYPADKVALSEVWPDEGLRQLYLAGESIWLFDPKKAQQQSSVEYFAVPRTLAFQLVVWVRRWRPGLARLWLFIPRVFLTVALLASTWIFIHLSLLWSGLLLAFVIWLVVRDVTSRVPRRLEVYVA